MHIDLFSVIVGLLLGFVLATFVAIVLTYFRAAIEKRTRVIETRISNAGPRPRGSIHIPKSDEEEEADEVRRGVIAKNNERGVDTKLEELQ